MEFEKCLARGLGGGSSQMHEMHDRTIAAPKQMAGDARPQPVFESLNTLDKCIDFALDELSMLRSRLGSVIQQSPANEAGENGVVASCVLDGRIIHARTRIFMLAQDIQLLRNELCI